ncbi:adenylosuccinate synthase [Candidatus Epulonipiscium viviparus]|uniref:adenylosuccinate synthase n=1 Tax=Candidatus Epulonipiscium viviparus TaxID=420336 RepID=UPI00016BFDE2|nr:adenylosuccinate synthase [Candidatus Epulopiscium viviparus]
MISAIVGGNWGDEGKGKITDLLAKDADIIIRFQGGANAGHTIINEYGKFALHLLPSGVFRENAINIIGQGVALNLPQLFKELDNLLERGVPRPNIKISDRAQIVMPYHVLFDQLEEERLGSNSFGSTKSGIAPFYADKALKIGIQVCELYDDEILMSRLTKVCESKNATIASLYHGHTQLNPIQLFNELISYRERLKPMVDNIVYFLDDAIKQNKNILLEGQLGALKDTDNGIYPFVTSSSPLAGFATVGAGIPPHAIQKVVTVVKAYSSAVGAGAFVSEIFGDEAETLRQLGGDAGEYGATTGRPRRMGYFDCVATRYGCILQGTTDVAFSLIDVLSYLDEIPVCVAYEIDGEITTIFPDSVKLSRAKPVIQKVKGFKTNILGVKNYDELPQEAKDYIKFIEDKIGFPITMISTGPKREDIIIL